MFEVRDVLITPSNHLQGMQLPSITLQHKIHITSNALHNGMPLACQLKRKDRLRLEAQLTAPAAEALVQELHLGFPCMWRGSKLLGHALLVSQSAA